MKTRTIFFAAILFAFIADPLPAPPEDFKPYKGSAEFERIKSLAGEWTGKVDHGNGPMDMVVEYRVIAGGSAVQERVFAGTPMEMVTMYYEKDGKLALTHFCMLKNRPALKLKTSTKNSVSFEFDKSCGIDPTKESHMNALTLTFNDDQTITHNWTHLEGGKAQKSHPFTLSRVKK